MLELTSSVPVGRGGNPSTSPPEDGSCVSPVTAIKHHIKPRCGSNDDADDDDSDDGDDNGDGEGGAVNTPTVALMDCSRHLLMAVSLALLSMCLFCGCCLWAACSLTFFLSFKSGRLYFVCLEPLNLNWREERQRDATHRHPVLPAAGCVTHQSRVQPPPKHNKASVSIWFKVRP